MRAARANRRIKQLAACMLWIGAWQAASLLVNNRILLAGPADTIARLAAIVCGKAFLPVVWFSFARIAAGFLLAFALGATLGIAAHRLPLLRDLLLPAVMACKSIPVACVVVLLLIWMGSRAVSGMAVFLMAFPAVYLSMAEALGQVDRKVSSMLRAFGVGNLRRFLAHTWPSTLPYLKATCRNACGMAWKAGVAAELIGTPLGSIGERVYQAKILLETADLFAWTIVIVLLSFAFERVFVWLLGLLGPAAQRLALAIGGERHVCAPAAVELRDVTFAYEGDPVLNHTTLRCAPGEVVVLDGASGTGKTTLLHVAMGLLLPQGGSVGVPSRISPVFQEARLVERMSAVQNVLLVSKGSVTKDEARRLLGELLPANVLDRPVAELSGGQRRRVEVVRALTHPSGAVLMDEPFSSLDRHSHEQAARFVRAHLQGRPLVVASHDPADKVMLLQGRV